MARTILDTTGNRHHDMTAADIQANLVDLYGGTLEVPSILLVNGAIPVRPSHIYAITKGSALADTLAAPVSGADDGNRLTIFSTTAFAHTVTATGLLQTGTASVNVATFAASAGAGLTLMAYQGKWVVQASVGITFS